MRVKEKEINQLPGPMSPAKNQLYPIFLKLDQLETLLVGGGTVALEKLNSLLSNSPSARITLISPEVSGEIKSLVAQHLNCKIFVTRLEISDLDQKDLVIVATNNRALNQSIQALANGRSVMINVADTPELCDFYMGSIVQKGS